MDRRPWRERVDDELRRRRVPARFRDRLLAELADHAADLTEEGTTMTDDVLDRRLGPPERVAATAAEQYRRATWVGRHPLVVFGLLPVPLLAAVFVGSLLALELVAYAVGTLVYGSLEELPRPVTVGVLTALDVGTRFLPFAAQVWLFTRLYLRHQVGRRWYALAVGQVLFLAGTFFSTVRYSDVPGESAWMMGFAWMGFEAADGWHLPLLRAVGWPQLAQVLAPVAVAGLMVRAARRRATVMA